jgi:hypothetical protein
MQSALVNPPVGTYEMGPLEVLDFGISWSMPKPWLQPDETIVGTPSIVQDGGDGQLTINPSGKQTMVSGGVVTWWCSTPTVDVNYNVHVTIVTSQGRTSTRRIQINGVPR